jgi:hypothetical protein
MPTVATSTNIENIQFHQQSGAPSTPAANYYRLYLKSDGLYYITSAGTEVKVASAAAFTAQTANTFLAGPSSAGPTVPTFRAIVAADLTAALVSPPAIGQTTPAAGKFTNLDATSYISLVRSGSDANVSIDSTAGTNRQFVFYTGGSARWSWACDSGTESGSNAGSDFRVTRYSDAGSGLSQVIVVTRSTGVITTEAKDAGTNAVLNVLDMVHHSSGTAAAGYGTGVILRGQSTTQNSRELVRLRGAWTTATDASRTARGTLSAYDTAERDCIMWEASGSATMVGFQGTAPIVKPTVTGSRGGNAALASLLTALANYGLVVDSSS